MVVGRGTWGGVGLRRGGGRVTKGVGTGVPGMAEWAAWLEEVLEVVANSVGSDIVGNIRSDPLNIRELRVVKTWSAAVVTSG